MSDIRALDGEDGQELPVYSPVCTTCRHFDHASLGRTCAAFPNGIPVVIWRGDNTHRRPYPGDNGLQYEPMDAKRLPG